MATDEGKPKMSLSINNEEAVHLLHEPDNSSKWSNHNDAELSKQRTVINLNNRNVRITLWSMVYMVFTGYTMVMNTGSYILYNGDNNFDTSFDEEQMRYYSLGISANTVIWWSAAILLCSLYCSCCNCDCKCCSGVLIVIGTVLHFVTLGVGM